MILLVVAVASSMAGVGQAEEVKVIQSSHLLVGAYKVSDSTHRDGRLIYYAYKTQTGVVVKVVVCPADSACTSYGGSEIAGASLDLLDYRSHLTATIDQLGDVDVFVSHQGPNGGIGHYGLGRTYVDPAAGISYSIWGARVGVTSLPDPNYYHWGDWKASGGGQGGFGIYDPDTSSDPLLLLSD